MLKFLGFGLIFLAFIMILPTSNSNIQSDLPKMYGIATLVLRDSAGNMLFENVIHNEVVNTGTDFMLDQAFGGDGSTLTNDGDQVDTMCVTNAVPVDTANTATAFSFNSDNGLTDSNCIGNIVWTRTETTASSGVTTFSEPTNFPANTVVTGIGICGNNILGPSFNDCQTGANQAPLLAVFDTTDVTVGTGESVDITYMLTLD